MGIYLASNVINCRAVHFNSEIVEITKTLFVPPPLAFLCVAWPTNPLQSHKMVEIEELSGSGSDTSSSEMEFDPSSHIWADLVPDDQIDGPEPLCPILYDPDCACMCN